MAPSVISIGTTETNPSLARNVSYAIKVVTGEMNAHLSVQNRGALLFPPAFSVHCCDPFENWVPSFLGSKFPGFPGLVTWVSWPGSPDPGSWVLGPPGFLGPRNQEARIFVPRPLEPRKCAPGPFIDPGFFRFIVFPPFCLLKLLTHISPPFFREVNQFMEETKAIHSAVEKAWEVPMTSVMSIKGMEVMQEKPLVANQKRKSQESTHGNSLMTKKRTVMEVSRP